MKKFVCSVCGYVYEGEEAPKECPFCHQPGEKFQEEAGETVSDIDLSSGETETKDNIMQME